MRANTLTPKPKPKLLGSEKSPLNSTTTAQPYPNLQSKLLPDSLADIPEQPELQVMSRPDREAALQSIHELTTQTSRIPDVPAFDHGAGTLAIL